jgi:two-component system cell cycle response regulator
MHTVRRIAGRLHEVAVTSGWQEAAAAASALRAAHDPREALALAAHLADTLAGGADTTDRQVVLLVEDDRLTAAVQSDILKADKHEVLVAVSLANARQVYEVRTISLFILDLVLPDADGRDLLAELRGDPRFHAVPIIVLSGRQDDLTQSECFALGADAYLVKPVHAEVLRSAVAAALDLAAVRRFESRVDRLTGLPNRTAFLEAIARAAPLVRRTKQPLTVGILDLDHFKAVNDTHGHAMGDEVLRRCAETISATMRISDFVARWGGEEFCVFLPSTGVPGAAIAVEKALQEVRALSFTGPDGEIFSVTFSAGIAPLEPGQHAQEAIAAADQLLYLAKSAGRNRVLTSSTMLDEVRPLALVAEDDAAVAGVVAKLLERDGFEVRIAADGAAALAEAEKSGFALAILDVDLPSMNGFDLLESLRKIPTLSRVPIVMLTATADEDDVVRGFDLGVNDYVAKPFFASELMARIRRLLKQR